MEGCCNKTCHSARRTVAEIPSGPTIHTSQNVGHIKARRVPLMYHVNIVTVIRICKKAQSTRRRHNCGAENLCMVLPPAFTDTIGLGEQCAILRENRLQWFGRRPSKRFDNLDCGAEVQPRGCSCSTESKNVPTTNGDHVWASCLSRG